MHFRWISFLASLLIFACSFEIQGHIPDSLANPLGLAQSPLHRPFLFKTGPKSVDTLIVSLINQVNEDSIGSSIEHLQHYGTRLCFSPQAVQAQNWLQSKLQAYGYTTYIQNLAQPSGSSGNVIATLPGALYPNEYIVLGAHYDSYTGQAQAPGADDNASGTAGILEIARVLSQHTLSRTLVLCLWAAEELGCYGSSAYAQEAAGNNINIMGYLNIDMCGYQYGSTVHTNVVGPSSAQPLMDFYAATCSLYLPAFQVTLGGILPGSSDHASFNTAGYMGIFPFEDVDHYSPYIHTPGDTLGSSVNSLPMAAVFTRAVLATALEMANQVPPPVFLTASSGQQEINLHWKNPGVSATEYHIFRDDMYNVYTTTTDTFFVDQNIITGVTYQYAVSLVSAVNGKESLPSNIVLGKSVGVMNLPFTDNLIRFKLGMTQQGWNATTSS